MDNASVIVRAYRGALCENQHRGWVVLSTMTGEILKKFPGSDQTPVFLRSSAKPFQSFSLYEHDNARSVLLPQEWAIVSASHSANAEHLYWVREVLKKGNLTEGDLQCGPHMPIDEEMAKALTCQHLAPTAIHNNCSGKHAGMLLACRLFGYPTASYLEPDHPIQQRIREIILEYSGANHIEVAVDGCGAPVFAIQLHHAARLYAQLAANSAFETIFSAMTQYPFLVGGKGRIDSLIMSLSGGNLVAKVGAEGFMGVGNRALGQGVVVKIIDGNSNIRDRLIIAVLEDLGWLLPEQFQTLRAKDSFSTVRTNTQNRQVGHFTFELPWV